MRSWICSDCGGVTTEDRWCHLCHADKPRAHTTPRAPRPEPTPEQWAHGLRVSRFLKAMRYLATGASPEAIAAQRQRLLTFMAEMERDYPGNGWAEAKAEFEARDQDGVT